VQALFDYGFSKFVRVRLAQRGQPVSLAPGRPAALQTGADTDALVRLDQLDQVRLAVAPGSGGGSAGEQEGATAWFTGGGRRLARVRLVRPPAGGLGSTSTIVPAGPSTTTAIAGAGPPGATLTAGAVVRVGPVPPGAPPPTIEPFLRRAPP
jgi:hypothetical protein